MTEPIDVRAHNRAAWDARVAGGDKWTVPVDAAAIEAARGGAPSLVLTPTKPIPAAWLGDLAGKRVLGLAAAGGQQGPLLAAAGARVTVFDNSPAQLERDRATAAAHGLELETFEGDMRDLGAFEDGAFDLVVHPVSNCFVPDVRPVWREVARVLAPGGELLAGFANPLVSLFDEDRHAKGELALRHAVPYSDLESLTPEERARRYGKDEPLYFGHSLTDQIGGQTAAGLAIVDLFEDSTGGDELVDRHTPAYLATRAVRASEA